MSYVLPAYSKKCITGTICMYLKVLSLYETVISTCMTKTGRYNDLNGIYVINLNRASISINYMLQQLYSYRHAYLFFHLVTYADNQAYYIFIHVQAMHISYTWIMSITCIHMRYFQIVFLYTYTITVTFIITCMIMFSLLLVFLFM